MIEKWNERTFLLIGSEGVKKLSKAHILVVGLGGVGAYSAEMLCRAGVGELTIVDGDVVNISNKNRQLLALTSTFGKSKAEIMKDRLFDINPNLKLSVINEYLIDEKIDTLIKASKYDYVIDAIDTIAPKVFLIFTALKNNLKIVSSMGAGGKLDPTKIHISEIEKTHQCRLAFIIRKRLHKLGVRSGFKAIYSTEIVPKEAIVINEIQEKNKLTTVGTISYLPAIFGCFAASVVINYLISE